MVLGREPGGCGSRPCPNNAGFGGGRRHESVSRSLGEPITCSVRSARHEANGPWRFDFYRGLVAARPQRDKAAYSARNLQVYGGPNLGGDRGGGVGWGRALRSRGESVLNLIAKDQLSYWTLVPPPVRRRAAKLVLVAGRASRFRIA
jgi:hypothetical protein